MITYSVSGGRLLADGVRVPFRPTPNLGGECRPRFLVMHFTSGGFAGAVEWLCNPEAKASAHLVISEAGDVVQLAPFDRATWHAGKSEWRGCTAMNSNSIGIELANYGELDGSPGRWTFVGRPVPDDRVLVAEHKHGGGRRGWHTYPARQVETALAVARALEAAFCFEDVCGHEDIAPARKVDPGPAFDLPAFRAAVLSGAAPVDGTQQAAPAGDRSVIALQRALTDLGFGPLVADGVAGPRTREAIVRFQGAHGLEADGVAGSQTWGAIETALAGRG
jgi:N-acetylmuramoyl-L-alanine amidase